MTSERSPGPPDPLRDWLELRLDQLDKEANRQGAPTDGLSSSDELQHAVTQAEQCAEMLSAIWQKKAAKSKAEAAHNDSAPHSK